MYPADQVLVICPKAVPLDQDPKVANVVISSLRRTWRLFQKTLLRVLMVPLL
jgi:hypothetical protein